MTVDDLCFAIRCSFIGVECERMDSSPSFAVASFGGREYVFWVPCVMRSEAAFRAACAGMAASLGWTPEDAQRMALEIVA